MNYEIKSIKIKDLIKLIKEDRIDLKPYYQRNDIWSRRDQEELIDSIVKGYPLPSFFFYRISEGKFEMVDGQQRARTIFRFQKGEITNSLKEGIDDIEKEEFLNYAICITEITNVNSKQELEEFYVLVNKKGKHLTTPELHKAEFAHTVFLELVEGLLTSQELMDLNLFTESASRRMNDRNFIEELVVYLMKGIQDKKKAIEQVYAKDISKEESSLLEKQFNSVIAKIGELNKLIPISSTRLKQRNDFYTLFNFIDAHIDESIDVLSIQYRSFLRIADFIAPSNEESDTLREYALHCVSQSNSKNARQSRLDIWEKLLCNKSDDLNNNEELADVLDYIERTEKFQPELIKVGDYHIINPD